jgi:hypothetical protein
MYFYKYQKPGNLEFNMLRRGEVYFASVSELNDASECRPRFILKGSEELWRRLAKLILQGVCFGTDGGVPQEEVKTLLGLTGSMGRLLKKQAGNKDFGLENLEALFVDALEVVLRQELPGLQSQLVIKLSRMFIDQEIPRLIMEPRYIASFSRNPKNPTMWGHYAGAETGFVVVYAAENGKVKVRSPISILYGFKPLAESSSVLEVGLYDEQYVELMPVRYGRKPPKLNAFYRLIPRFTYSGEEYHYDLPLLLPSQAEEKEESHFGLVKYSDWRYEQEVRAFFPDTREIPQPVRVLEVSTDNIKGLIFGPKMGYAEKVKAVLCCYLMQESSARNLGRDELPPDFFFFQAKQLLDRFDFSIVPVGVLERSYYGDRSPLKPLKELDPATKERLRNTSREIAGRTK